MDNGSSTNVLWRFFVYCNVMAGVVGLSSFLIQIWGGNLVMRENSIVEWAQVVCLFISAILLYCASKHTQEYKELFRVLFILPVIAIIRENDNLLETYVFDEAWEVFVIIGLICLGYILVSTFRIVSNQFIRFTHTQPFICFVLGFFIVFAFSRIVGQQKLWQALLQERHHRMIGGFIEEIMEFFGYCIILLGSLECWYQAKYNKLAKSYELSEKLS